MTTVGTARFIITSDNAQALQSVQQVAHAARKQLEGLKVTPTFTGFQAELKRQIQAVQAQVAVTLKPITQAQVDAAIGKVQDSKTVKVSVELDVKGDVATRIAEIKAKLAELRSSTQDVLKIDTSAVERVIADLKTQIADLRAIQSQLPKQQNPGLPGQGGGGGGPPNALQGLRNDLRAGITDIAGFEAGLQRLQTTLRADITAMQSLGVLTADDTRKLSQMTAALAGVNAEINKNSITKLRGDLAGARTAFEQAIGAAGRFNFVDQRQATQAYEAELARLQGRIRAVGQQAGTTQADLRTLNGLSQQLASQRNAINGVFSQVGLAGNITNALKSLPQFAAEVGGSLGAAFTPVQQFTGGLSALGAAAGPVGIAVGVVTAAVAALAVGLPAAYRQMDQLAAEASKAATTLKIYQLTVSRTGQDQGQAAQLVSTLADKFKLMPDVVQDAVTQLLRAKFSVSQIETVLTGAGASALAFGRDAKAGFEGVTSAALTQTSAALNAIGVAENLDPAYQQYAKSLGITADKLTDVQKNQVLVNLVSKATQGEVAVLSDMMGGYAGKQGDLNLATGQLRRELGEAFLPTVLRIKDAQLQLVQSATALVQEWRRNGPVAQELRGHLTALLGVLLVIKTQAIGAGAQAAWGAMGATWTRLIGIVPALTGGLTGLAGAQAALNATIAASPAIIAVAAAALAVYSNKIMADTARAYDAADQGNQASFDNLMNRVRALQKEGTELGRAKAKYLLIFQQLQDAQQGELKGVKWTGERIYGPPDEARVKKLQADLAAARTNVTALTTESERHAAAAKNHQGAVQAALKLTDDQLKKQASTVKDLRETLARPVKLFGGTEFQGQLDQIAEKYRQLRDKLREDVLDPKLRNELSRQLSARQAKETGQTQLEYRTRAGDSAAAAERQVQQARVAAMADGSAKIRAQAVLDIAEARRTAAESAKAWRDFPKEKARILAAGEAQARQIQAEANRKALEADQDAAKKQLAEARRVAAERKRQLAEVQKVADLGRRFNNLNQDFGLKWSQGAVTAQGLQNYQQAVAAFRSEVEKLPKDQQARFSALFGQAGELEKRGQALVGLKDQIKVVSDRVKEMTVTELEAARARWAGVPAAQALVKAIDSELPKQRATEYKASVESLKGALDSMSDAELEHRLVSEKGADAQGKRLKLIQEEIKARQQLRDATLLQGRLEYQKNDAQAVISTYEARKTAAQGDAAKLLQLERQMGAEVLAARQRLAQVDAEQGIVQIRQKFSKLIEEARAHGQSTTELERQQGQAIQQVRDERDRVQLFNKIASDQGLIKQTQDTTTELIRLANERAEALDTVENQRDNATTSTYDLRKGQAGENLAETLRVEKEWEQSVVRARQDMADRAAAAEIRAQEEKYRLLIEKAKGNDAEQRHLETELGDWIVDRGKLLETERERIAWEGAQNRIKAEKAVADAILQINRALIDGLNQRAQSEADRKASQSESDLQQELRAVGDNEEKKLAHLRRSEGLRILLAEQSVNARIASETEAEERRWADLQKSTQWTAADAKLRERLTLDHQARLTAITTQGEFDKGQKVLAIRNQTEDQAQRVQEKTAQDQVKKLLRNLSDMAPAQRVSAEATLRGWLDGFKKLGVAGQTAAKVVQDALDQVAGANTDARARVSKLADEIFRVNPDDAGSTYMRPDQFQKQFGQDLGKIGKPEGQQDAIDKARAQYDPLIKSLKEMIGKAEKIRAEFEGRTDLNALEQQQLTAALTFLPLYEKALGTTVQKAQDKGEEAGAAFTDALGKELVKAQDSAADSALQLAEANLKLAASKGLDGSRDYNAALQAYRDYWKARMGVLGKGLADAQKTEADARSKLATVTADPASTTEQRTAAQTALNTAITGTSQAQADLNTATTNYVTGQEKVIDSLENMREGTVAISDARRQYDAMLGLNTVSYQSEIRNLDELIKKYPAQAFQLEELKRKYQEIQRIRQAGIATKESLKLDFQIGFNGGGQKLSDTISSVAQGFGQLTNPLSLLATIIEKLNIVGTVMEGIFSAIEEPVKALQEPFRLIGQMLGSLIAANLQMLAPILAAVVNVFVALYDAIAEFIHKLTFGFYDIRRKNPQDSPSGKKEVADLKGENDKTQLDLDYRQGLISREKYEAEKLRLAREGLDRQQQEELEGAKGNAAKIEQINRKYDLAWRKLKQETLDEIAAYEQELAGQAGENDQKELDRRRRQGLITERQYQEESLKLTLARLERERQAELRGAEGDQRRMLEINRKYDGLVLDAKLDMLDRLKEAYRQIGDTLMGTITGSIKDGLMAALRAGNFGLFRTQFRQKFREAMFEAVLAAAIETAAIKGILQPAIDALTDAFASGDQGAIDQAVQGLMTAGAKAEGMARKIYKALKPLRDAWGIKGENGQSGEMTVTGQIDKPEMKISLDMLSYLAETISRHIPPWREALLSHVPALTIHTPALIGHTAGLENHLPALTAHTAALPQFSTAVDQFGLHEQAYQTHVAQFGTYVSAFGGHVSQFGQHVQVLAGAAQQVGNTGFTPKR